MRCGPECSSYSLGLVTSPPWASASLCLQLGRKKKLILSDGILHWYFYDALVLWNYTTLLYHSYPWNLPKYPIIHRMKSKSLSIQESPVHFGLHLPLTHVPRQQCTPPIQIRFFTSNSQTCTSLFLLLPSLECASCSFFFYMVISYLPSKKPKRHILSKGFPAALARLFALLPVQLPRLDHLCSRPRKLCYDDVCLCLSLLITL